MGYSNYFKLKITGEITKPLTFCRKCDVQKDGNFCSVCGSVLDNVQLPVDKKEIINELREFSDDCSYLLSENGGSNEGGNGGYIESDVQKFSEKYPSLIFQLDCDWDSGFDEPPSRYYFKNGQKQDAKAKIEYKEPEFD